MGAQPRRGRCWCTAPVLVLAAVVLLLLQPCASQDLIREMRVYNGAGYACMAGAVRSTAAARAAGCPGPVHANASAGAASALQHPGQRCTR